MAGILHPHDVDRSPSLGADWRDYLALLKPRVVSLVVFTGLVGMLVAPASIHPVIGFTAMLALAVGAGAAGALNMCYDADIDAIMRRTQQRPLPAGRVAPDAALAFALILSVGSVAMMGLNVNWLAAGILAFSIFFYAVVYTMWLKRRTPQNIVIGGAAGAFPPLVGWAAATGEIGLLPLILFAIVFLWTPPHFWALSLVAAGDYQKAGIPMLPVVAGRLVTRRYVLGYSILLAAVSVLPWALGLAGWIYGALAAGLGLLFVIAAVQLSWRDDSVLAWRLFGFSIFYLFALFSGLLVDYWILA